MKHTVLVFIWLIIYSRPSLAEEKVAVYTFHIGMNDPLEDSTLSKLRYADDDALRMFLFMSHFSTQSVLSTVLDAETQKRFSPDTISPIVPKKADIDAAISRLASKMASDRKQGRRVIFYFTYSGHGEQIESGTRIHLLDGYIDKQWLKAHVLSLQADVVHLIIDACYADGLVDARGVVKQETDAVATSIPKAAAALFSGEALLDAYPNAGALVSASSNAEAYEWSELGSGVFTHELLSAFAGAADVNSDGNIAYSEVAAFISAANRSVVHPKGRPDIVSHPPMIDRNIPILSFNWSTDLTLLKGNSNQLSRFYVETTDGSRLLDVHLEPGMPFALIVPPQRRLWVSDGRRAASFVTDKQNTVDLASLAFTEVEPARRGSIANALLEGLFASEYGPAYYTGWVDSRGEVSVSFERPDNGPPTPISTKNGDSELTRTRSISADAPSKIPASLPSALFATGGVTFVAGGIFMGLAIDAQRTFVNTSFEREAKEAMDHARLYTGLTVGLLTAAAVSLTVAGVLQKKRKKRARRPTRD